MSMIPLLRALVSAINSITYTDTSGDSQTFSSSNYSLVKERGRYYVALTEVSTATWPSVRDQRAYAVTIQFVAGKTLSGSPATVSYVDTEWAMEAMRHRIRTLIHQLSDGQQDRLDRIINGILRSNRLRINHGLEFSERVSQESTRNFAS